MCYMFFFFYIFFFIFWFMCWEKYIYFDILSLISKRGEQKISMEICLLTHNMKSLTYMEQIELDQILLYFKEEIKFNFLEKRFSFCKICYVEEEEQFDALVDRQSCTPQVTRKTNYQKRGFPLALAISLWIGT